MSGGSFLDGLGGFDLAGLLEQLRQAPQGGIPQADAAAPTIGLNPLQPVRGAGDVDPSGRGTGPVDQRRPSIAMDESQVQALERAQAGPADAAALSGNPLDRLLYDRSGFGGGPGGFSGSADPYGSRNLPLPPGRPSDADLMVQPTATGSVAGMNPDAMGGPQRQVVASSTYHPDLASNSPPGGRPNAAAELRGQTGDFDPLTGTIISGTPRPIGGQQAPASPFGGAPSVPAQPSQGLPAPNAMMERYLNGIGNDDVGNLLRSLSYGLLTQRGIGPAMGAAMQHYESGQLNQTKQALQSYQLLQQQAAQNAVRAAYRGKASPEMVEAAALNPTVLQSLQTQVNQQPSVQEIDGKKYWLKPGERPGVGNLIGDVTDKDPVHFDRDPVTGELTAYRTSQIFPDKGAGAAGAPVAGGGIGSGAGAGQGDSADAGNGIARTLIPGNRGVRIYGQPDPRTGQIVQPPPNSPPGVSGYYDASGKPNTLDRSPETERDKAVGGAIGKDIAGYIEAGKPAREKMAALNILDDAWKAGKDKITTGPSAERVLSLKQFARGSLGLNIGDDIAPSELIAKIGTQLATADAKSLTARPTQFDFATYLRNNPGLALTPEGNAALINIKKQQAQHEIDLAALARDHKNWDTWDEVTAAYDKAHPIISPLTRRALGADEVNFPDPNGQRGDPAARYQQLMRNGMSKSDAFAQMRREGL